MQATAPVTAGEAGGRLRGSASASPAWCCARSFFLRLCSEVPILEDTLMRILVIGLSRELPLGPADAMELADHLVKRAAAVQADGEGLGSPATWGDDLGPWAPPLLLLALRALGTGQGPGACAILYFLWASCPFLLREPQQGLLPAPP